MKKKTLLTLLLSCISCILLSFSSCVGSCSGGRETSSEVLLAGFENYEEMLTYHYINYFGSAKPSKEYVTQGKGGASLTVNGRYSTVQKPTIVIDTQTEFIPKEDFSGVKQIKLDVRNDNDYSANIYIQYASVMETGKKMSSAIKRTLEAGFSGTVTFDIDRAFMSEFLDLKRVTEIRILFDSPKEAIPGVGSQEEALANYRKFHIDNLRAVTTNQKMQKVQVRADGEIESGDREEYLAAWYLPTGYIWSPSTIGYNTNSDYIKDGNGSLKFTLDGASQSSGSGYFTAYWAMSINQTPNISDYGAVGFWIYNAEETEPITMYFHSPLTNMEKIVKQLDYGWNYIEYSVADLCDVYGFIADDFLMGFTFQAKCGKDYELYLDEMHAIRSTIPQLYLPEGENIGNLYYKRYDQGATVMLPEPTTKHTEAYAIKVLSPTGEEISVLGNSFVANQKGEYTVVYTATAKYPDENGKKNTVEKTVLLAVGDVPTFTNLEEITDVFSQTADTQYALEKVAESADPVSWQVETFVGRFNRGVGEIAGYVYPHSKNGYENGVQVGSPQEFYLLKGIEHRITYTAKNADGLRAIHVQRVYADDPTVLLSDRYDKEFYTERSYSGDLSLTEEKDGLILRSETTKATGTFTNSVQVGYQANFLRFMVYNAGETEVKFFVNEQMAFKIAPNGYALFNPDSFGYQLAVVGWKMVSSDSKLLPITFTATSQTSGVHLIIDRFGVNADAFEAPTMTVPQYEPLYQKGYKLPIERASLVGLGEYDFVLTMPDGHTKSGSQKDLAPVVELAQTGEYTIVYKAVYEDYDGSVRDLIQTRTFQVISDKPVFIVETKRTVDSSEYDGTYLLQEKDKPNLALINGQQAEISGWKVCKFHRDYKTSVKEGEISSQDPMYAVELAETEFVSENGVLTGIIPQTGYSYLIEYTIQAYGYEFTETKTLFFTDNSGWLNITELYPDFYTTGTSSCENIRSSDEKGITFTAEVGLQEASGGYHNPVSLGNLTKMNLVFRNDGKEDVYLYFYGAPENMAVRLGIKAGHYASLEFDVSTLRAWGFIDDKNVFGGMFGGKNMLYFGVFNTTGKVNLSLCSIWIDENSVLPVIDGVEYKSKYFVGDEIEVKAPTVLYNAGGYKVAVKKVGETQTVFTCTSADVGTEKGKFSLEVGRYVISYSVEYIFNGQTLVYTVEREFLCEVDTDNPKADGLLYDKWSDLSGLY